MSQPHFGKFPPIGPAERMIYEDLRWWSETRLDFVLNHLEPWWLVAPPDSPCPGPFACEAHYGRVQHFVWRIGHVLLWYQLIPPILRERDFATFDLRYEEFFEAWKSSASHKSERRLPTYLIQGWWEAFGGNLIEET